MNYARNVAPRTVIPAPLPCHSRESGNPGYSSDCRSKPSLMNELDSRFRENDSIPKPTCRFPATPA